MENYKFRKEKMKYIYNVMLNENDICLHKTLRGAKECQKKRGGKIVKEEATLDLLKDIEK